MPSTTALERLSALRGMKRPDRRQQGRTQPQPPRADADVGRAAADVGGEAVDLHKRRADVVAVEVDRRAPDREQVELFFHCHT
jgi:hypothetical protein